MDDSKVTMTQHAGDDDDDDQPANPFAAFVYKGAHGASSAATVNSRDPNKARVKKRPLSVVDKHVKSEKRVKYSNSGSFKLFLEQLEEISSYRKKKSGNASVDEFRKYLDEKAGRNSPDALFHGLIATVLSTQTLDKVALAAAKEFEKKFKTIESCEEASLEDIEDVVKTVNFKNNKAKFVKGIAKMLVENYSRKVPSKFSALMKLPGVGPKIAHLVRSVLFQIDESGVVVDSNVYRVARRIGWGRKEISANDLSKTLGTWWPKGRWADSTQDVVGFGQLLCTSKKPKCTVCPLKDTCMYSLRQRFGDSGIVVEKG